MTQPLPFANSTPSVLPAHQLEILISAEELQRRVAELAEELTAAYSGKDPVMIAVLKGAFVFVADLIRSLDFPISTEFIRVSSYGNKIVTSGEVKMELDVAQSVAKRHVVLIEDIIDTGLTIDYLCANMAARSPASVKVCTLLHKPTNNIKVAKIDFIGFNIPNQFVVGYGLDYHGYYRNLPYIATLEEIGGGE